MLFSWSADLSQNYFFKKKMFKNSYQTIKWFGSGSKHFVKVNSYIERGSKYCLIIKIAIDIVASLGLMFIIKISPSILLSAFTKCSISLVRFVSRK